MTGKELIKLLKKEGWTINRVHGSHHIMEKDGRSITVPVHNTAIQKGLLHAIKKEADLK
ncbi:MAG: type II toxin-antitoxin system HicA family toxin [Lachnospiraceae bacterium]|uniref:type II toxin-antitoxin system HicA family toxin n=1 Tax=uncultured Acetatifactor sp. TaxID=1671927 RepID=UPI002618FCE0|nr:type II toxin-antitoxin system HicA family toxin [uncultured Acetatifactor sp.]MCI8787707.1 type II toxin-antitoxin system HicA family toxin [Lachnospiraceae bacterium]